MTTVPLDVQCTHRGPSRLESRHRMRTVLGIAAGVMVAEALGGWLAHSLALLADAGHMLADVAAIGLSLVVAYLAQRPATAERTFGLLRLEILAALVNGAVLIVISLGIALEAYHRFRTPAEVHGALLVIVAAIGLAANAAGAAILHRGHDHSLNQRGAYLHILSDLLGSLGALVAGVIILTTGWVQADPLIRRPVGSGARAHPPLAGARPHCFSSRGGVGARPPRLDRDERCDRDERASRRAEPGRQPARARGRAAAPRGHGDPARDGSDGAGPDLRLMR